MNVTSFNRKFCFIKLIDSFNKVNQCYLLFDLLKKQKSHNYSSMGNISANFNDPSDDQTQQLSLNIDFKLPVKEELKQLLNWSLAEIREIYAPFRRRKGSPILTRSEFLRFIHLSRITSFYIYDSLIKTAPINVFEILTILVLAAYTSHPYKVHFLFNIFDLRCNKKLSYSELNLMFKSLVRGFCFLTGQTIPDNDLLEKYGHVMFSRADLNNDQLLELGEIQGWLETQKENLVIFNIYDPKIPIKEDYFIFNSFQAYSLQQVNGIVNRLQKLYTKQKIQEDDYLMLKPIQLGRSVHLDQSSSSCFKSPKTQMTMSQSLGKQNFSLSTVRKSFIKQGSKNGSFLPQLKKNETKPLKKKFQNIIIIKGRTITKKEVFQLREYFGNISGGKKHILIEDFIENFNQEKYNHMKSVAASLFNFLDKKQHGKIEFLDLVTKLYPNLTAKHLQTIQFWSDEYNRNFNTDKKAKPTRDEEVKKRILPKTCIPRLQELFRFFDRQKKGFVTIENLKQILGRACSDKQILNLFQSSDADKDGKLTLREFVHVLLPPDLEIEGLT